MPKSDPVVSLARLRFAAAMKELGGYFERVCYLATTNGLPCGDLAAEAFPVPIDRYLWTRYSVLS